MRAKLSILLILFFAWQLPAKAYDAADTTLVLNEVSVTAVRPRAERH